MADCSATVSVSAKRVARVATLHLTHVKCVCLRGGREELTGSGIYWSEEKDHALCAGKLLRMTRKFLYRAPDANYTEVVTANLLSRLPRAEQQALVRKHPGGLIVFSARDFIVACCINSD